MSAGIGIEIRPVRLDEWQQVRDIRLEMLEDAPAAYLEVREDNMRARGFYHRRGFAETGQTVPYLLDPAYDDIEMELRLR